MTIEIDDLSALYTVFNHAHARFNKVKSAHGCYTTSEAFTPSPDNAPDLLDAWADYRIAKRRYERALLVSRRGDVL